MPRLAENAREHITDLIDHGTSIGRDEASILLEQSIETAPAVFSDAAPLGLKHYPSNYQEMARYGLQWRIFHRHRIGAPRIPDDWVITSVLYDSADIPKRLSTDPS